MEDRVHDGHAGFDDIPVRIASGEFVIRKRINVLRVDTEAGLLVLRRSRRESGRVRRRSASATWAPTPFARGPGAADGT